MRAVLIGLASQPTAAACRARLRISAYAFFADSPRAAIADLRSLRIADRTASMSAGRVAWASAAICTSITWKRWKS